MTAPSMIPLRVAALRLGYTPERVLRLIATRKLMGELVGARYFVSAPDLSRFERERAVSMHVAPTIVAGALR